MGLAEGGITFRTYYVDGELPANLREDFLERIRARRFRPLTIESEEDLSLGWVPVHNALGTTFQSPDVFFNQYLVLALRVDRWALPPVLLKAAVRQAERAALQDQKKTYLTRTERGELLDRERGRLKRQSLPAARFTDLAWNLDSGVLRFSSLSRSANDLFANHFELTFQMRLVPDGPYMCALNVGLADELVGRLAEVEPADILGAANGPG